MASANPNQAVDPAVFERIASVVGARGYTCDAAQIEPWCQSWRDNWVGDVGMLVRPASTTEMAEVVQICHQTGTPIVPQGGNTGLTGASQPHADRSEIIVSTSRMNRIVDIDLANDTMTVEAGCILEQIQLTAQENQRLFPLSLAAEGSCQIGGNLATNAGGTQVLRYGNARALVLGVEVVLADGRIWNGLRALRKDNTGYDLKQLFIGAEGTLGIITQAVLKLFPQPSDVQTAFVALPDPQSAVDLLSRARELVGDQVVTFELIQRLGLEITARHISGIRDPFDSEHPWYVLMEITGQGQQGQLRQPLEQLLAAAFEADAVVDAVVAESAAQRENLWAIREKLPEAQNHIGVSVKHDVSVPISQIPTFIAEANRRLQDAFPNCRPVAFGHVGDGNIHFNVAQPEQAQPDVFKQAYADVNRVVHDLIAEMNGSISAEHGLGRLRMEEAERYKSEVELDLMRTLKKALDPNNILNPGKVVRL